MNPTLGFQLSVEEKEKCLKNTSYPFTFQADLGPTKLSDSS